MKKYRAEIWGAIICLGLGMLGAYATNTSDFAWYTALHKPSFNPPTWLFGPVWTVLYILMGIALGKLWRLRKQTNLPLVLFIIQLIFNILWSPLFFQLHRIDLALYDMCALWLSLVLLLIIIWKHKTIFLLLFPYGLWVSFALILNISLYYLNC